MQGRNNQDQQPPLQNDQPSLPSFASTPEEIRRAVERGAIQRGSLLIHVVVGMDIEGILRTLDSLSFDPEDIAERSGELGIDPAALNKLDTANPPIPYVRFFCIPEHIIAHPRLIFYYRNIAMLSSKVMNGIGLSTTRYEKHEHRPSPERARELASYFNRIASEFVTSMGVSPLRHLEIVFSNIGDSLGGTSRNEVGRQAAAQVMRWLLTDLHERGYLASMTYKLKGPVDITEETDEDVGSQKTLNVTPAMDLVAHLSRLERQRVKYQEIILRNGNRLLLDKQMTWSSPGRESYKVGPDMHSCSPEVDMLWAGELKGGADPAGSDEHWKTAKTALDRILTGASKTNRPQPKLSFLATILVRRVALEAQEWIDEGRLTSVYNLTRISKNPDELRNFLDDMREFLGYTTTAG